MSPRFSESADNALPLYAVSPATLPSVLDRLTPIAAAFARSQPFGAGPGELLMLPGEDGKVAGALAGLGPENLRERQRFTLAAVVPRLPEGPWRLEGDLDDAATMEAALGWLLESYRFDRYRTQSVPLASLVAPEGVDAARVEAIAAGECLTRDLINIPANDMGPAELESAANALAVEFGATMTVTGADDLLENNFPLIHTVGRAATEARGPRLIDMSWGDSGPTLTLVGKGVCFDTGGLDIKPAASMGLMKKDMGGAATVLGLARMIMQTGTKVRLRVLIPAVENAIASDAFRPGDILPSRKGLTVEINNTDAEGRLVLADALALADETPPDLMVSMATLTGAARVAVGPDLAPFYATTDSDASALAIGAVAAADPVWRLPYHAPYEAMIEPGIADLDNAPKGGMAGSITAALFLRRFVTETPRYMHFDIYGWNPATAPGRPKGGVGQGARALFEALPQMLDL
ncbi:leucyl aminopeptidase family protein [Pelagovum pacificum]|uniref:Leucyl aminopeptidase family protein n=1 Tax=Pelagovum pacificum TaxID=2588711 RepID=A0A5C5GGS7_9RHOB|nr:leucyl aminopeptidase family protein [Pelagovum pacificum]QQA42962.1 leucyl aminopeptidase family protein [Pelagovum pacificum]TNY33893.1 leucyl aminopeptidase family protein [Pelagovum pacificum]